MIPTRFKRTLMAAIVAPALAAPTAALAEGMQNERQGTVMQESQSQAALGAQEVRASELLGMDVENREGEQIGEIQDLVIDRASGKVEYAALQHGGFLGIGEDLFAYPMSAFGIGEERDKLVLDVSEERLDDREGFNDDNWPKVRDDQDYWASIDRDFGVDDEQSAAAGGTIAGDEDAGASGEGQRQFMRASELMDREGVQDLVVSLQDGDVRHIIGERDGEAMEMNLEDFDLDGERS